MKKNKNLLPPFLMIRSGLFNSLIVAAAVTAGTGLVEFNLADSKNAGELTEIVLVVALLTALAHMAAKRDCMNQDIDQVVSQMQDFKNDGSDMRLGMLHFPRMAQRLVRYMSQKDPVYFNKMVENPKSIQNSTVERDIAIGHLKSHPKDAYLLKNTNVDIEFLPRRLYRKIMRANKSK